MKWIQAALIGALGSLLMFILMMTSIHGLQAAPFNQPPSAAFLDMLGMKIGPLPLLVHFGYGIFWSLALVGVFQERTTLMKGLGLATALWLFMMLVYSPLIGWGVFGIGGSGHQLNPSDPLYIGSSMKYIIATFVLHLIYGATIGGLNAWLINFKSSEETQTETAQHWQSTQNPA